MECGAQMIMRLHFAEFEGVEEGPAAVAIGGIEGRHSKRAVSISVFEGGRNSETEPHSI